MGSSVQDLDAAIAQRLNKAVKEIAPLLRLGMEVHPLRMLPEPVLSGPVVGEINSEKDDPASAMMSGEMGGLVA